MKKTPLFFVLILFLVCFSCKTAPENSSVDIPEEENLPNKDVSPENEALPNNEIIPVDEDASIVEPDEEPQSEDYQAELLEPLLDFPEEFPAEFPDSEQEPPLNLIPPNDLLLDPLPELPSDSQNDEISVPAEPASETQTSPNTESSEPEPLPPEPPAFLRPAEPIVDDTIVREAIPLPVNPIPELPAQPIQPLAAADEIDFSRIVHATVGQLIEIPFRGSGWVFLGEIASRRGISYNSRRMDPEGQSFIFLAEQAGTYILKFYKEDYVRDYILNDHVQVIIGEAPEPSGTGWFNPPSDWSRVIAEPRWPEVESSANSETSAPNPAQNVIVPEAESLPKTDSSASDEGIIPVIPPFSPESSAESVPETETSASETATLIAENATPEDYFEKAQVEFDAGRIAQAISILEQFRRFYPAGSDEAFWLLGQFYEANSPNRDIRTSLDYYHRLVDEFPQSRRYSAAKSRIAYLERFYLNLR
jgi:hypothetical protein